MSVRNEQGDDSAQELSLVEQLDELLVKLDQAEPGMVPDEYVAHLRPKPEQSADAPSTSEAAASDDASDASRDNDDDAVAASTGSDDAASTLSESATNNIEAAEADSNDTPDAISAVEDASAKATDLQGQIDALLGDVMSGLHTDEADAAVDEGAAEAEASDGATSTGPAEDSDEADASASSEAKQGSSGGSIQEQIDALLADAARSLSTQPPKQTFAEKHAAKQKARPQTEAQASAATSEQTSGGTDDKAKAGVDSADEGDTGGAMLQNQIDALLSGAAAELNGQAAAHQEEAQDRAADEQTGQATQADEERFDQSEGDLQSQIDQLLAAASGGGDHEADAGEQASDAPAADDGSSDEADEAGESAAVAEAEGTDDSAAPEPSLESKLDSLLSSAFGGGQSASAPSNSAGPDDDAEPLLTDDSKVDMTKAAADAEARRKAHEKEVEAAVLAQMQQADHDEQTEADDQGQALSDAPADEADLPDLGDKLADELQELIDEEAGVKDGEEISDDEADDETPEGDFLDPDDAVAEADRLLQGEAADDDDDQPLAPIGEEDLPEGEEQTLDEIDAFLADEANSAISGDFETVDDVLTGGSASGEPDQPLPAPATTGGATAADVAAELDSQPERAAGLASGNGSTEDQSSPASLGLLTRIKSLARRAGEMLHPRRLASLPRLAGPTVRKACELLSAPAERLSPDLRRILGYVGLLTLFNGSVLLLGALAAKLLG